MLNTLRGIRNEIIRKEDMKVYSDFLEFLYNPTEEICHRILEDTSEYETDINWVLHELFRLCMTNKSLYREKILHGQVIIWKEIFDCVERLSRNQKLIEKSECHDFDNNYIKTNDEIKHIVSFYVDSQAAVSKLEEHLGIDRYLDRIAEFELSAINQMVDKQKRLLHKKIEPLIQRFQDEWGNDNIADVVYHKLYKYDKKSQICSLMQAEQRKVILFVIDGLGWCQFQWHKLICSEDGTYAYKESIFNWLEKTGNSKELIIGTPLVTDTAAGLSQIYTGEKSNNTGVFASKYMLSGRIFDTKKLNDLDMYKHFNTNIKCISSVLDAMGKNSEILYCSRYNSKNSGFANFLYGPAEIKSILPPERVYTILLKKMHDNDLKSFSSVYLTTIDNTSHTMGAFSKLEKYEHKKMDSLFKNFLIELAEKYPEIFEGDISMLFIADHGMSETSSRMIYKKDLENVLKDYKNLRFVINNRSCFVYGLYPNELKDAKKILEYFFMKKNIGVHIIGKGDAELEYVLPRAGHKSRVLVPDLIISLVDNALFYHSNNLDDELMHFAGHGGASINEKFVPLIEINLTKKLLKDINDRFIDMM